MRTTRSKMLRDAKEAASWSNFVAIGLRDTVYRLDVAAPGWSRVTIHEIAGEEAENGFYPDSVYEVRGGVFLRGWDMTGAIGR